MRVKRTPLKRRLYILYQVFSITFRFAIENIYFQHDILHISDS